MRFDVRTCPNCGRMIRVYSEDYYAKHVYNCRGRRPLTLAKHPGRPTKTEQRMMDAKRKKIRQIIDDD